MANAISLIGGRRLDPTGRLVGADLHLANGKIVDVAAKDARRIDCAGLVLLPGMIDVHGDAYEAALQPRAGVRIPTAQAMRSVDRMLLASGITTAYHGVTLSWEPGARDLALAKSFLGQLDAVRPTLAGDHRVQLRWEVCAPEAVEVVLDALSIGDKASIAFNDHTHETLTLIENETPDQLMKWAQRVGVSLDTYIKAARAARPDMAQSCIEKVAEAARRQGAPMLAHDEASLQDRKGNRALGMHISEFPVTSSVAEAAIGQGEHVVMGAPNVVQGGSHKGNLSAVDAVRQKICSILASDYHYPSMMAAVQKLVCDGVCSLADGWDLVSANAASAMGLGDRGRLQIGLRADVVVIDMATEWRAMHVITAGKLTSFAA